MRPIAPARPRLPPPGLAAAALVLLVGAAGRAAGGPPSLRDPLDRAVAYVSSFGEYRYDHLHAGVDLSTGGRTGLPVRAAADGRIYRLKVEWRGYGRALYLRHADGRATVYGHLERFEDKVLGLEKLVARRRRETGNPYPGDIYLDPAPAVRRGQVIAYSGESGAGLPHLHFEVRDPGDAPIDPFRAGLAPPRKGAPPHLEALVLTVAEAGAWLDGDRRTLRRPLVRRGGVYEPEAAITVRGAFEASLIAWDPSAGGRAGLRSIEAAVDGRTCYRLDLARFRFDQYPLAGLIFDHRESHLGPTRMAYRLAALPGNVFASGGCPAAEGTPPGAYRLSGGTHLLTVVAQDERGAVSRARVVLQAPPGTPTPDAPVAADGESGALPPGGAAARPSPEPVHLRALPGFLDLTLPGSAGDAVPPGLAACGPQAAGLTWRRGADGFLETGLPYPAAAAIRGAAASRDCPIASALSALRILWATPGAPAHAEADGVRVDLPAGARFFPGPLVLSRAPAAGVPEGLAAVRDVVDVLPAGEALDRRATLAFDLRADDGDARRLGIYRWDRVTGRWGFESDAQPEGGGRMIDPFRRYGRFALLRDEAPPRIVRVHPAAGARVDRRRPDLAVWVDEVGKGLAYDGVTFELDGGPLEAEFDPDRGVARPREPAPVAAGAHHLVVRATDRAGNRSADVRVTFTAR